MKKAPRLRFRGFQEDWELCKVKDFLIESKIKGSNGKIAKKLTVKLWRKGIVAKEEVYEGSLATQYYVRKSGQFMYGKLDFLNQAFGIVPIELDGYESTVDSPSFDFKPLVDSVFFLEYVSLEKFYKYQGNIANGSRKAKRIHVETFFNMPLPTPSYKEQQKIGTLFKQLDDTITLHQRKLEQLKELKKAYLQLMFPKKDETVPRVRFADFEDDWQLCKLGATFSIIMGQSPNSENYTENPDDYILVQGNSDMKNNKVVPRIWTTQVTKKAEKGDLILSVRAPVGEIGKTDYNVVLGRGVAAVKGNDFIFQQLRKMKDSGYWTRYSTGSTFESINSNDIKEALINIPNKDEQQKIGDLFTHLDDAIILNQNKLNQLKSLKKSYLQNMFI
ncbi:restriction endonuclease subunit S [Enterococcus faecalis]